VSRPYNRAADILAAWNAAGSRAEVARALGYKTAASLSWAVWNLRRLGYRPKRLQEQRPRVPTPEFVRAWNASDCRREVADRLGMNPAYVHVRAVPAPQGGRRAQEVRRRPAESGGG
jgi:hypothetical protein